MSSAGVVPRSCGDPGCFAFQMTSANPQQFGAPLGENQYMEQEEEWEREGLLDPAWEKQQRKVRQSNDDQNK